MPRFRPASSPPTLTPPRASRFVGALAPRAMVYDACPVCQPTTGALWRQLLRELVEGMRGPCATCRGSRRIRTAFREARATPSPKRTP